MICVCLSFVCIREFRFYVRFCRVGVYVHQCSFGNRCDDVVGHCTLHAFVQFLHGIAQVGSLYQYVGCCFLFRTAFLVEGDEVELALEPSVGSFLVAGEELAVVGAFVQELL